MHISPPHICIYFITLYADKQQASAHFLLFYMQILAFYSANLKKRLHKLEIMSDNMIRKVSLFTDIHNNATNVSKEGLL